MAFGSYRFQMFQIDIQINSEYLYGKNDTET